jgi:hypothetical protein
VLALGIVLAQVLADQLKPFPTGQACGVLALACWSTPYVCELALACWSTPYVCEFRCNGPGSCIDLNDRFWACPYDPLMSWIGAKRTVLRYYQGILTGRDRGPGSRDEPARSAGRGAP